MALTKKDARLIMAEFKEASRKEKAKLWDKLVPYANKYPEIYRELVVGEKENKDEQ